MRHIFLSQLHLLDISTPLQLSLYQWVKCLSHLGFYLGYVRTLNYCSSFASLVAELGNKAMRKWNFTQDYQSTVKLDLHLSTWQSVLFALVTVLLVLLAVTIFILCIYIKECGREWSLRAVELQIMKARQATLVQKVASFTVTKYQPGRPSIEDHCPICMGEYCDGEDIMCSPCGHVLHGACLVDWFMHGPRPTCPCCRHEYALDVVKDEAAGL